MLIANTPIILEPHKNKISKLFLLKKLLIRKPFPYYIFFLFMGLISAGIGLMFPLRSYLAEQVKTIRLPVSNGELNFSSYNFLIQAVKIHGALEAAKVDSIKATKLDQLIPDYLGSLPSFINHKGKWDYIQDNIVFGPIMEPDCKLFSSEPLNDNGQVKLYCMKNADKYFVAYRPKPVQTEDIGFVKIKGTLISNAVSHKIAIITDALFQSKCDNSTSELPFEKKGIVPRNESATKPEISLLFEHCLPVFKWEAKAVNLSTSVTEDMHILSTSYLSRGKPVAIAIQTKQPVKCFPLLSGNTADIAYKLALGSAGEVATKLATKDAQCSARVIK